MEKTLSILMAILVGICLAVQPVVNAALGKAVTAKVAAFHSVLTSAVIIGIITIISGNFNEYCNIKNVTPLYWIGGVFGIAIVFLSIKVIPELGAASAISIFISVQLIIGALINQFGLFGVQKVPIDLIKLLGMIMLVLGARMVVR